MYGTAFYLERVVFRLSVTCSFRSAWYVLDTCFRRLHTKQIRSNYEAITWQARYNLNDVLYTLAIPLQAIKMEGD